MKLLCLQLILGLLLVAGCSKPSSTSRAPAPASYATQITEVSGGKQISGVGSQLPDPIVVQVNGADGNAVPGALVSFHGEGLIFTPLQSLSDSSGQVSTLVRLGFSPGDCHVTAETPKPGGGATPLNLRVTALGYEQKLGKAMNDKYCVRCHDPESTTERVSNMDNLSPKPHAFSDGAALSTMQDSNLTAIISGGGAAVGKSPQMPAWGNTMTKSEIKALVAYIRAVADPPYPGPEANAGNK